MQKISSLLNLHFFFTSVYLVKLIDMDKFRAIFMYITCAMVDNV